MASTSNGVRKGVSSLRESDGIAERRSLDDEEAQWYATISNPRNAPPSIITKSINIRLQTTYDSGTLYPNFGQRRVWGAIFSESRSSCGREKGLTRRREDAKDLG
jgi:hypothetical protein